MHETWWQSLGAQKDLHLCRLDGFENPQLKRVPYARFLDPTHGGLASAGQ